MVKFWDEELKKSIAVTITRIKFMEKHGIGKAAMEEKAILQKQQKRQKDRKDGII